MSAKTRAMVASVEGLLDRLAVLREALRAACVRALEVVPRAQTAARVAVLQDMLPVLDELVCHPEAAVEDREQAKRTRAEVRRQLRLATGWAWGWLDDQEAGVDTGAVSFELFECVDGTPRAGSGPYATLGEAMGAAGHVSPDEWATAPGVDDYLFVEDVRLPRWVIYGAGAVEAYATMLHEVRFGERPGGGECQADELSGVAQYGGGRK